jgi:Tetratricopeptide repeat
MRNTLHDNHPDRLICQANLAVVLRAQGRTEEADALQHQMLTSLSHVLGADHPNVLALRGWKLQNRDLEAQPT